MADQKNQAEDFTQKVLKTVGIVTIVALIILLSLYAFRVLLLIMAGVLITAFFRGISGWLSARTPLKEPWSLIAAVLGVIAVVVLAGILIAPRVSEQANKLSEKLPQAVEYAKDRMNQSQLGRSVINQLPDNPKKFMAENSQWFKKTFGVLSSTFGIIADVYVIFFIGVFITAKPKPYIQGVVALVPINMRGKAREIMSRLGTTLQRWLIGKLLSMLIVAILTAIGLFAMGVPLALVLGIFAGLMAFIPNFGPIIGLLPAFLMALMQGTDIALYVILLFVAVQFVESNIITPLIQKEMVYLPPAMIIIAQVLLGILAGGLGLILATPIIAVVMVLIKTLYIKEVLGDESEGDKALQTQGG